MGLLGTLAALLPRYGGGRWCETMTPMRNRTGRRRPLRSPAVALLGVVVLGSLLGCGSASEPSEPSGVDGLVIPTPDPDPADFVATVDNPWFPVLPGARWTYEVRGGSGPSVTVVAEAGPRIDGVLTTTLVRTSTDSADSAESMVVRDHYAQDRAGNVWWFGREGEWSAGTDGAKAGLAMPATPRFGDGFIRASRASGEITAAVDAVAADPPTGLERFGPLVVLEVTEGATVTEECFARGVGLVRNDRTGLVAYDGPGSD